MKFNEKLKNARKGAKITQVELAEKLNVTQGTIANWERGAREPDVETIKAIAAALSVPVELFFRDTGWDTPADDAAPYVRVETAEGSQPIYVKKTFTPRTVKSSGVELLADPVEAVTLNPDDRKAAMLFSSLPDDKKKDALSYMQYLADKAD